MKLILAVIDELYTFAVWSVLRLIGKGDEEPETLSFLPRLEAPHPPTDEQVLIPTAEEIAAHDQPDTGPQTFKTVEDILTKKVDGGAPPTDNSVMYIQGKSVPVFQNPTKEFDTVVGLVEYGDMIMVFEHVGRYARIASSGLEGWILRDELVDRAAYVYPEFIIGNENGVDDATTVRTRAILKDEFGGSLVEYSLQAGEYVSYRLLRKGLRIPWGKIRPRVPGSWHLLLKGVPGVHMGISPKTGSIMEYMLTDEMGHLAYVEAVFPDETITISEANYPDSGIYNERVLTRDEWKELRPVFIQVV